MRPFVVAIASALPAVLLGTFARAADPPNAEPPTAPAQEPPPPPAYAPPAPPVALPNPYAAPVAYDVPPPDPYDVRYPKKNAGIYIAPLSILTGTIGAELDLKVASAVNLNVGTAYTDSSLHSFDGSAGVDIAAWAIEVGPQFFPLGRAFNQLYVYPRALYVHGWGTDHDPAGASSATANGFGFATTVGYQWTYVSGFSLRLGAGFAYVTVEGSDDQAREARISGLLPALDASLGWTF
jgi:hypothetical protein